MNKKKKIASLHLRVLFKMVVLVINLFKQQEKIVSNTCLKNVILLYIRKLQKLIKNIILYKKLKLKYTCPSPLYVDHAHIV